jgi:AraC family transcriptional regulator of adaptative response/methylated-DNA-[protein]-cysteine methyltransferase
MTQEIIDSQRIKKAIEFIAEHSTEQPNLDLIAEHVHLSPFHFQRLFLRWAGISPKKFLQYITLENSKKRLAGSNNLAEVAYDVGLSGTGRLHDLYINIEGMTPDQYRNKGGGITVYYDFFTGPFGKYLLAITPNNKICSLFFIDDEKRACDELQNYWVNSKIVRGKQILETISKTIFAKPNPSELQLFVKGTPFQIKVWEALLKIPSGRIVCYQTIADYINKPNALRAVGSAIGKNPISYLIPCHRVIRKAGNIGEYRWGSTTKTALIGWEASKKIDMAS